MTHSHQWLFDGCLESLTASSSKRSMQRHEPRLPPHSANIFMFCFDAEPPSGKCYKLYCRFKFHHVASMTEPTLNRHPISTSQLFSPLFWFYHHCISTKSLLIHQADRRPTAKMYFSWDCRPNQSKMPGQYSVMCCIQWVPWISRIMAKSVFQFPVSFILLAVKNHYKQFLYRQEWIKGTSNSKCLVFCVFFNVTVITLQQS